MAEVTWSFTRVVKFMINDRFKDDTFEIISENFQITFPKTGSSVLGECLSILLENFLVEDVFQKCLTIFLLWDMYKDESLDLNPYLRCILVQLTEKTLICPLPYQFKIFMHNLMLRPDRVADLLKMTFSQILSTNMDETSGNIIDWSGAQEALRKQLERVPKSSSQTLSSIIPDPEKSSQPPALESQHLMQTILKDFDIFSSFLRPLRPQMLRLQPPLLPMPQLGATSDPLECSVEEFQWLNPPTLAHEFHWDSTMGQLGPTLEVQQLASLALTTTLTLAQKEQLHRAVADDHNIIKTIGFSPENFSSLVNQNPITASTILSALKSDPDLDLYLAVLLEMDLNVQMLEVINQTASRIKLPEKFILNCISNLLTKCQNMQDKSAQMRIARIVCLVTSSWLRNKALNITSSSIFAEIESFSLDFCKIREANTLYRLVKSIESGCPADKES